MQRIQDFATLSGLAIREADELLWRLIADLDPTLSDERASGLHEMYGEQLRVRWLRSSSGNAIACEVAEVMAGRIWEIGLAEVGSPATVRGFMRACGADLPSSLPAWDAVRQRASSMCPATFRRLPTFAAMVHAALGAGEAVLVENGGALALLTSDLEYWRDLARTQARMLKDRGWVPKREQEQAPVMPAPEAPKRVWRLTEVDEWAAQNEDRIVVLPRAIAACKKAVHAKPECVFEALELLAGPYREEKTGVIARGGIKARAEQIGVEIGGSVERSNATDSYMFDWRGRRRFLDTHLKRGNSRDPRFCLRVYFTWDPDIEKVVVGWLPSHLENSLS